jgi:2-C-methyl-D-erythritol 2,4-cyclodiphosphate synthase
MRENIKSDLQTDLSKVSVKATTSEGMGFVGREEGISAMAVVLLESIEI